jgi:DNA-binding MarR family transcriptional regulator
VLDRLERKRLVRRRVNAADRRSFTIELTAAGEIAAERVRDAFSALDARVRDDLPPTATEGFHQVLETLERHTRGRT